MLLFLWYTKIDQLPVCWYWLRMPAGDQWRGRQWRHGPDLGTSPPSSGHRAVRPRARVRSLTWTAVMNSGLRPPDVLTQVKPFMQRENCGSYKYFGCQIFWNPRIWSISPPACVFEWTSSQWVQSCWSKVTYSARMTDIVKRHQYHQVHQRTDH